MRWSLRKALLVALVCASFVDVSEQAIFKGSVRSPNPWAFIGRCDSWNYSGLKRDIDRTCFSARAIEFR